MNNKSIKMRRHHRNRIINKRKNDMTYYKESAIGKHITHPVKCSGPCCGNPRNHYGNSQMSKTFQELKNDLNFEDALEETVKEIQNYTDEELQLKLEESSKSDFAKTVESIRSTKKDPRE